MAWPLPSKYQIPAAKIKANTIHIAVCKRDFLNVGTSSFLFKTPKSNASIAITNRKNPIQTHILTSIKYASFFYINTTTYQTILADNCIRIVHVLSIIRLIKLKKGINPPNLGLMSLNVLFFIKDKASQKSP